MRTTPTMLTIVRALVRSTFYLSLVVSLSAHANETESDERWSEAFKDGRTIATMQSTELSELSGLAASHQNPGLFWAHNDSGNDAEIFLIEPQTGEIRLGVTLEGIDNIDFEDIAVRQADGKSYVVVGDFGDNRAVRDDLALHQFEEPKFTEDGSIVLARDAYSTMYLAYAEGPRDAETLLAAPDGTLFILSKRQNSNYIYALEFKADAKVTLSSRGNIALKDITAGDINQAGEIALRTYAQVYYWPASNTAIVERLSKHAPERLYTAPEPQGEALAWDTNGNLYSIPEKRFVFPQVVNFYERKP